MAMPEAGNQQSPARASSTRMPRAAFASRARFPPCFMARDRTSVAVELDPKQISRILHSESGHNTIFDVDVAGSGRVKAMIVDWQHEPIKDKLMHIDLKRIAMDKAMTVSVPIKLMGVPVGVKTAGRHPRPGAARSGDRVPAGRHSAATSTWMSATWSCTTVLRV